MRYLRYLLLGLGLFVVSACPACAGVYNPGESEEGATYEDFMNSPKGRNFRDVLIVLRSISVPLIEVDNPVRRRYIFEDEVLTKNPNVALKIEDRLQASAVLIRRRKFKDAELLLRPVALQPGEQDNLPLQSNLATALHMQGDLQGAYDTLYPVVKEHWQTPWDKLPEARQQLYKSIGWSDAVYDLYRDYDAYYLKLIKLRKREKALKKDGTGPVQLPDALFDDGKDPPTPVRFVNEGGDFTAGRIASTESAKLPPQAMPIVQQLLVWMPDDLRLYWLLAELYNAQKPTEKDRENEAGMQAAQRIFLDLNGVQQISDEVRDQLKTRLGRLTTALEAIEAGRQTILEDKLKNIDKPAESGFPVDWRTVAISFGAGFVLAIFVTWQVREVQRRRYARLANQTRSV